jgi:uncharacterized protein (TIGR02118 family)
LSDDEFYGWWHNSHGLKEFGFTDVLRYVQHHTLAEARNGEGGVVPTRDGASIGWYRNFDHMRESYANTDRSAWSQSGFDPQMDVVIAEEHVVLAGPTTPGMVKFIAIARRNPKLSVEEFQRAWREEHGPRWKQVPGMRRYTQNHAIPEAYEVSYNPDRPDRRMTHDGWSEDWFDDIESLKRALTSPEAHAAREHSVEIFDRSSMSYVIARPTQIVG